jgi:hypothetical protein
MRHATALLYHVCAVASRSIRFASCGMSGKLTLWTRYVHHRQNPLDPEGVSLSFSSVLSPFLKLLFGWSIIAHLLWKLSLSLHRNLVIHGGTCLGEMFTGNDMRSYVDVCSSVNNNGIVFCGCSLTRWSLVDLYTQGQFVLCLILSKYCRKATETSSPCTASHWRSY